MKRTLYVLFVLLALIGVIGLMVFLLDDSQAQQRYRAENKAHIDALLRGESVPLDSLPPVSPAVLAHQLRYPEDVVKKLRKAEYVLPKQ